MFFYLAKILGFFALPSNLLISLALVGVVLMGTKLALAGRRLVVVCLLLLAMIGLLPVGTALELLLEERFPPWDAARGAPSGIVVLGGGIEAELSAASGRPVFGLSGERIAATAELARRYPTAQIVFTGGSNNLIFRDAIEADHALPAFENLGVTRQRIVLERRARNTAENAAFTAALVKPQPGQRWLLVTSAAHMPRAIGTFRRAGFQVEAYPVDWRAGGRQGLMSFSPFVRGLRRADIAIHEWAGLVVYWITGRTSALFPGPSD